MRRNDYEMAINTVPRRCACKRWIYEFWWWFQKQKRANEPVNETKQREKKKWTQPTGNTSEKKKLHFIELHCGCLVHFPLSNTKVYSRAYWNMISFSFECVLALVGIVGCISLEFVSHRLLFGATKSTTTTCAAMHCNMTCHSVFGEHAHVFAIWFVCSII